MLPFPSPPVPRGAAFWGALCSFSLETPPPLLQWLLANPWASPSMKRLPPLSCSLCPPPPGLPASSVDPGFRRGGRVVTSPQQPTSVSAPQYQHPLRKHNKGPGYHLGLEKRKFRCLSPLGDTAPEGQRLVLTRTVASWTSTVPDTVCVLCRVHGQWKPRHLLGCPSER